MSTADKIVDRLLETSEEDVDSPEAFFSHQESKLLKPGDTVDVTGRRWFNRTCGNTYHAVTIYINGKHAVDTGVRYGFGDQWQYTAKAWLEDNNYVVSDHPADSLWRVSERMGFKLNLNVVDVKRKRDL